LVRRVEEPAFGLERKFGNRVEVLPGEAFGGAMAYGGTGIVKPPGGLIRLIGMVGEFISRGSPRIVQVGKPV
jgi:hypothetical protein